MLDQKDIQLLEKMFEKSQQNIINTVDEKITHSETRILKEVDVYKRQAYRCSCCCTEKSDR